MTPLRVADSIAHFLERFHLIPGRLLKVVCDRWERAIWAEFGEVPNDC